MVIVTGLNESEFQNLIHNSIQESFKKLMLKLPTNTYLDNEDIMSIDDAAKFLKIVKPTLYSKVSKKEIPYMKVKGSKRIYFSRKELTKFLEAGRKKTNLEIEQDKKTVLHNQLQ